MFDGHNIFQSTYGPRNFRIIGKSGNIIYRPDEPGVSVSVDKDTVMTMDSRGNPKEIYKMQPGERVILVS